MNLMTILQDLISRLDLVLPWLLPTLETIEQMMPATGRLSLCALLMVWFAVIRQRETAESQLQRVSY